MVHTVTGQLQGGQQMPGMGQPRQQMQSNFQQLEGQAGGATRLTMVPVSVINFFHVNIAVVMLQYMSRVA